MVIVKLYGGIGNQMFQYAAGRHLALLNNTELKLDISHYKNLVLPNGLPYRSFDLPVFNIKASIAKEKELNLFKENPDSFLNKTFNKLKHLINPVKFIREPHFHFYPELLSVKGNIYLDGYWQSEKYFKDIEHIIREDFTIKTSFNQEEQNLLNEIKNTNSICLNIRRQEFASNPKIDEFVGVNYINNAINLMAEKIENPSYYIFSDELSWCKKNISINYPHFFVEEHLYGEKFVKCLFFMSSCKHNIIPNSTFGWWGAWLNNNPDKIIIAPKNWLKDKAKNTNDILPESWIKI